MRQVVCKRIGASRSTFSPGEPGIVKMSACGASLEDVGAPGRRRNRRRGFSLMQAIEQQRSGIGDAPRAERENHVAWSDDLCQETSRVCRVARSECPSRQEPDQIGTGDTEVVGFPRRVDVEDHDPVGVAERRGEIG